MEGLPLYIQVRNGIQEAIEKGAIKPSGSGVLPTQQEFAAHFEVGIATVKRAIKDLEQMGLVTSRRGKGLVLNPALRRDVETVSGGLRMKHVGIALFDVTGRMSSPYFQRLMRGIEAFSNESHVALHVISLPGVEMEMQEDTFLSSISLVNLDGMLILSPVSSGFVAKLMKREIPYVAVNVLADRGEVCHVTDFVDDYAMVVDAILRRGLRRPLVFLGNETKLSSCLGYFGYKQALARHGLRPDPSRIAYEDYDIEHALRLVDEKLNSPEGLDSVVAYDDVMGGHVYDHLASRGIRGILIAGRGNLDGYEDKVTITTDGRLYDIGHNSLRTLIEMMRGEKPEKTKFCYDAILIERDRPSA